MTLGTFLHAAQVRQQQTIPAPEGTHTENGLAGYAKILCSGVFVSGRAPEDVARGSAYFFMPRAEQEQVQWTVDRDEYSITRPQEYPPNTDGRYRNSDPLTIAYLAKLAVTNRGENFLTWPQRALFDKIGIRRQVLETDPYGNFLITGYGCGTARNWARIGLLYLQDGIWQGQRILPDGWATFVSTPAPAWKRPEYGGFFWLNRVGTWHLPPETYFAAGAEANTPGSCRRRSSSSSGWGTCEVRGPRAAPRTPHSAW